MKELKKKTHHLKNAILIDGRLYLPESEYGHGLQCESCALREKCWTANNDMEICVLLHNGGCFYVEYTGDREELTL